MNTQPLFRGALGALIVTFTAVAANADEASDGAQLFQPGFDRLIPTSYPLVRPDFAKLKVTTHPAQLTRPNFDRLIPTSFPVAVPNATKFRVVTYPVNAPAAPVRQPPAKSPQPAKPRQM